MKPDQGLRAPDKTMARIDLRLNGQLPATDLESSVRRARESIESGVALTYLVRTLRRNASVP